ncbi:MAG: dephospho-CoA kinase [Lutibacter sp.]|uniref:dephospho-CoA kinase n=1 Tax=Lutibacter sp. TaxID=1925666 RepID=UPI0019E08564|nr:dephospho-CoA kinase [Lutibacter sp.]NOR27379.1 dephospho-CoA kinase [Lutibacter sp.]
MIIVGLTGGIGSGKSTVLQLFKELGAVVYIADVEAKELMNSDKQLIQDITTLFGEKAYVNNKLSRNYIANVVFNDKEKLKALNTLVHPKVKLHFKKFIEKQTTKVVMYESAILFESGTNTICDYVITVTANFEDKIERIIKRDKISKQQILERMQHQTSDVIKIEKSDFIITNTTLEATKKQVDKLYKVLVEK